MSGIRELLEPRSIAIVGASASPDKAGYILLKNLLDHGFPGRLYSINPSAGEILGLRAYASVAALPERPWTWCSSPCRGPWCSARRGNARRRA